MRSAVLVALVSLLAACPHKGAAPPGAGESAVVPTGDARTRAVLEEGAADLDVSVRRTALAALVRSAPEAAGGAWGKRGRFDPSEYVHRAVIDALEARPVEPESVLLLRDFATGEDVEAWTRGRALLAMARVDPEGAAVIREAASVSGNPAVLLAAALVGDAPLLEKLGTRLSAGDLPLELWFFGEVARSGLDALVHPLERAIVGSEPEVQGALVAALARLSPEQAHAPFELLLAAEPEVVLDAVDALRETGGPGAVALLYRARSVADEFVAGTARLALVALGERQLNEALETLSAKKMDPELRVAAYEALGMRLRQEPDVRGADRARAVLREALTSDDPRAQMAAIAGLPGDPALRGLLDDESLRVRVNAAAQFVR